MSKVDRMIYMVRETINDYKSKGKPVTIQEVERLVVEYSKYPFLKLNEAEIKNAINEVLSIVEVQIEAGIALKSHSHKPWLFQRKSETEFKYWNRYKKYLYENKKFPEKVINIMDNDLDIILDMCGDPKTEEFYSKGLVMGDVQSGKTANYLGLISKASDVGYKVFIILTGTIEKLRKQTQARFDEGFVGSPSDIIITNSKDNRYIGVGQINPNLDVNVFTSTKTDFRKATANSVNIKLNNLKNPVLFVMKKNVTVLNSLLQWLKQINLMSNQTQINQPVIIIDDEADNASVNTKKPEDDPSKTNKLIRDLASLFKKSTYIGYTATPFANIFIQPDNDEDLEVEDLFPKDFIYLINPPSNYIGAENIFSYDAPHNKLIRTIDDAEDLIPLKHKRDWELPELPVSFKKAISCFILANTIKQLTGLEKEHSTMLVNISRFNDVQENIGMLVNDYFKSSLNKIELYSKRSEKDFRDNQYGAYLYLIWEKEYKESYNIEWENIQNNLYKSNASVQVKLMNQKKQNTFDYDEYSEGLKVIAIGGLSLSRGLTLEGLTISYFYRNSKLYDALLQMGRWFGYRTNYDKLCRIWMSEETIDWYGEITLATMELKDSLREMRSQNKTPKDFGLKIRNDQTALKITSYSKMRNAKELIRKIKMGEDIFEVTLLKDNPNIFQNNLIALQNLYNKNSKNIKSKKYYTNNEIVPDIKKADIIEFISGFATHLNNTAFNKEAIIKFINDYPGKELESWDLVFIEGEANQTKLSNFNIEIKPTRRKLVYKNADNVFQISGSRNRLGGPIDGRHGLEEFEIDRIKAEKSKHMESKEEKINLTQKDYFKYFKRSPLIMIYFIEPKISDGDYVTKKKSERYKEQLFLSYSIGFPKLEKEKEQYARYKVNLVEIRKEYEDEFGEDDDE